MHSRPKSFIYNIAEQNITKKPYITKTADITNNNAFSFDKLIRSKEQGDAVKNVQHNDYDDIIKKYKVHFQTEPTSFEGIKVEKVRAVHRCVSTESKGFSINRERKRKLNLETKNPLLFEKIRKYRDLKQISKSCNLVPPPPASKSVSTSDTTTDKQENKTSRCNYRNLIKSKEDAATNKSCPRDYNVKSQISFCNKQSVPTYNTLYDSDARRKSLLRTIRLQRLLNRLIILKARQKKKLNWINFIKELKIKHQLQCSYDDENEKQQIAALIDSYSSNSNTDVTRPFKSNTTANISNFQYKINTSTKTTNASLRNKAAQFRSPHKTYTATDIKNFYRKYSITDTCNIESPKARRCNYKSKFTTQMIDDFFNPEPRRENSRQLTFTEQDASLKFAKILRAEENVRFCADSTSSSNPSMKKASRRDELKEKYSRAFFPKPSSSFSKSEQRSSITIQRSYSFIKAGRANICKNVICSTSTQTDTMLKPTSDESKERNKSVKIKSSRVSDVSRKSIIETDMFPQKLETQGIMEAKIDSILQSVNSLLTEIRIHKSKIIVAEKEASLHNKNIQEKKINLNLNHKNSKRRYILNESLEEINIDLQQRKESKQDNVKYKSYPVSYTLYTKDKCIEVSKSLANSVEESKASDDELTDCIPFEETRITPINSSNKKFLSLVRTILPFPYKAIKKIISYVPSINYYNYLTMLPIPVTLTSKPLSSRYLCNLCGARFENAAYLSRHIELNHLSKIRDCCVCRHVVNTEHRKPGVFRCCYCSQVFTRAYCCELHQQSCAERMGFQHDVKPSLLFLR